MKYQHLFAIFLITMLLVSDSLEHQKPKSSKKAERKKDSKGKKVDKSVKNSKIAKKKKFYAKKIKNTIKKRIDLDVMIRFAFARYSSNAVAELVTGILQSIYIPMYRKLKNVANSRKLVKKHIECIDGTLRPFFDSQKQSVKFVNSFIKGIKVSNKTFMDNKIFKFTLKRWFSSNKTVKISDRLISMKHKRLSPIKKISKMRNILGRGTWMNVLSYMKFLIKFFRTAWFNSSFFARKVLKCAIHASSGFSSFRRYFIVKYKMTKRVLCNMNPINALVRVLRDYRLTSALDNLFKNIAFKGIKLNKIHHVNWTRIGRSTLIAYQSFASSCPL